LSGNSGLITRTEGKKDDNPLPQSDATPDRRGIAYDQDEGVPVCEDRSKVQQRLGIFLACRSAARQRRPGDYHIGGTEHTCNNKSATPAQQRSDAAEQERQRCTNGE